MATMLDSTDKTSPSIAKALLYGTCLDSSSPNSVFMYLLPSSAPVFPEEQQISLLLS